MARKKVTARKITRKASRNPETAGVGRLRKAIETSIAEAANAVPPPPSTINVTADDLRAMVRDAAVLAVHANQQELLEARDRSKFVDADLQQAQIKSRPRNAGSGSAGINAAPKVVSEIEDLIGRITLGLDYLNVTITRVEGKINAVLAPPYPTGDAMPSQEVTCGLSGSLRDIAELIEKRGRELAELADRVKL